MPHRQQVFFVFVLESRINVCPERSYFTYSALIAQNITKVHKCCISAGPTVSSSWNPLGGGSSDRELGAGGGNSKGYCEEWPMSHSFVASYYVINIMNIYLLHVESDQIIALIVINTLLNYEN